MPEPKTKCRVCNAEILVVTANRTGGVCMPCSENARYQYLAYLSIKEFFSKTDEDGCLAPNLDAPPGNAELKAILLEMRNRPGVKNVLIPVIEFENAEQERNPASDRVFVVGKISKSAIERWAGKLRAGCYREPRAGAEVPLEISGGQPVWCVVWD